MHCRQAGACLGVVCSLVSADHPKTVRTALACSFDKINLLHVSQTVFIPSPLCLPHHSFHSDALAHFRAKVWDHFLDFLPKQPHSFKMCHRIT
jgi:hypothetical protein